MSHALLSGIAATLFLCTTSLLFAADERPLPAGDIRVQAVKLIEQGQVRQGYDLLKPLHEANPGDIDSAFILGQAALLMNRPGEAATLFRRILASNPNLPRVRAELGRAYTAMGEVQKALAEFQSVLSGSPPAKVGDNIRKLMAATEAPKSWNIRLSGGYIQDSNVNAGPSTNTVLMFGLPFQLSSTTRESSDHGYSFNVGAGHQLDLGRKLSLQSSAQLSTTRYNSLSAFNAQILSLSTGPALRFDSMIVSAPLLYEYVDIGQNAYSRASGIAPQLRIPLTAALSLNASLVVQSKSYYVNDGLRDGRVWSAIAGTRYSLGNADFIQVTLRHTVEGTRRDYLDNHSNGINLGVYKEVAQGMALYLSSGFSRSDYAGQEAAYDKRRGDTQYSFVANLSKELRSGGLSAVLGFSYTRNDSNLSLYNYERKQITLQVSQVF
ncbi:MAG: surface lipoprotein assembly modifier [Betaproteobacteria bacterium]